MKKLLIVNNNMHIGGIQKALLNLLEEIGGRYDVTLFLFAKTGDFLDKIPKNVHVVSGNFFTEIMGLTQSEAKQKSASAYLARSFFALLTRIFTTKCSFGILSRLYKAAETYDCAISYMQNGEPRVFYGGCAEFVLHAVHAKRKLCFLHCNFANYGGNTAYNRNVLERFDAVPVVSDSALLCAEAADPLLKNKLVTVPNCVNFNEIERMANECVPRLKKHVVKLFTAARFSPEKGVLRMLPILKNVIADGEANICWYVAGAGPQLAEITHTIKRLGLREHVVLLGNLVNPYPYFKHADIVLVPSYDEAAPMVFTEARIFGTPVFTTATTSAKEMIADADGGWVCENSDEGIQEGLKRVLKTFKPHKLQACQMDNKEALSAFDKAVSGV